MDVREHLRNGLRVALAEAGIDPLPDDIALERPANRDHGDWSSNVALATANAAFSAQNGIVTSRRPRAPSPRASRARERVDRGARAGPCRGTLSTVHDS